MHLVVSVSNEVDCTKTVAVPMPKNVLGKRNCSARATRATSISGSASIFVCVGCELIALATVISLMYSFCRQLLVSARNENKERLPDVANNGAARQKEGRNERIGVTTTDGGAAEGKEENNQIPKERS